MPESTKPAPVLLPQLLELLRAHRPACGQDRVFHRLVALTLACVCALGRHTLTQLLVTLGRGGLDWSAAYRLFSTPRLDDDQLTRCFVRQTLAHSAPDAPYLVAVDGVQLPRASRTMPGTSWLHAPRTPPFRRGIHRAQRFAHLAWLTPPTPEGYSRALPLRVTAAFPAKAVRPKGLAATTEGAAGLASRRWLREELDAAEQAEQPVLAVADGRYSTKYVWRDLPDAVSLLARCARNRALYARPGPRPGRGRPRKYGERAPTPAAGLHQRSGWTTTALAVRGRAVPATYRAAGPYLVKGAAAQPLYLLVVQGLDRVARGHRRRREPSCWLVSAVQQDGTWTLPFPAEHLLACAWQRWEIEVTHRELKAGFGLGEGQAWTPSGTVVGGQWRAWAWAVLVLAGYRAWGTGRGPLVPLGRWSVGQLWQGDRQELWAVRDFRQVWLGTVGSWTEILDQLDAWLATQPNAALGARRT
jgi:hypothetical protein